MSDETPVVPAERIERSILFIRGQKVLVDADLADLYDVETRVLIQAVKRNTDRFPADFMFQLSDEEFSNLRSQSVTSRQWGGRLSFRCGGSSEAGTAATDPFSNAERRGFCG